LSKAQAKQLSIDPHLAMAARQHGEVPLHRAWMCLHHADPEGSGILARGTALQAMQEHGGWTQTHCSRLLDKGNGLWWWLGCSKRGKQHARLIGAGAIAARLGTRPGPRAMHPASCLRGQALFAAACYAAWVATGRDGHRMLSRETLQELWHVTLPTLLKWERVAGVSKGSNWAALPVVDAQTQATCGLYPDCDAPGVRWRVGQDGRMRVWRQLPNTYASKLSTRRPSAGACRSAARLAREAAARPKLVRLYHDGARPAENLRRARAKRPERSFAYARVGQWRGIGQWLAV